ncbi:MAG: TadE/TadG family type IV pilus assembly protein [Acidimicrobiia bacterium]
MKNIKREDGATLVEMAFVLPLLILLILGSLEFGLAFKERLTVASAANSAGRTGATMGNRAEADIRILEAIEVGLYGQVDPGVIVQVDIFKADPDTGAKTGAYDRYQYDGSDPLCKWTPCPDPNIPGFSYGGAGWPPDDRDTTLEPTGGGLDVLGVEITYHHTPVTNILPYLDRNFVERALVRLEPDVFGASP